MTYRLRSTGNNYKSISIASPVTLHSTSFNTFSSLTNTNVTPTIISVTPTEAYNYEPTKIIVTGTNFSATPKVFLGNLSLSNISFVDSTTLFAVIPAHMPSGLYGLTVINPDGQNATLTNAFTVQLTGNGAINPWLLTTSMTAARSWLAAVTNGSYVYALGSNRLDPNRVEQATINADGSLSQWQDVTAMTTARQLLAAVIVGDYIYAVGGEDYSGTPEFPPGIPNTALSNVEWAKINVDGSLSEWQETSSMTQGRQALGVVAAGGYLYAIGGSSSFTSSGGYLSSVERAQINVDGSLGPWQTTTALARPRCCFAALALGNYLYAIGGQDASTGAASLNSVERAVINPDGSLGVWELVEPLREPRCNVAAATVGSYIYTLGGGTCTGEIYATVERTKVNIDGTLAPWSIVSSMTTPRNRHAAVASGDFLYVVGGETNSGRVSSVERAVVNPIMLLSVSPSFVPMNRPSAITIKGVNFLPIPSLQLGETTSLSTTFVTTTTLTSTVPGNLVSGTYSLTLANPDGQLISLANAIRVDGTTPVAGNIIINGGALDTTSISVTLSLSASDATDSTMDLRMIFSNDGITWSNLQPYAPTSRWLLDLANGRKTVYAQFVDRAGNISEIISDTIQLVVSGTTDYGLSINDGALYTNQTAVTLTVNSNPGTAQMQISNDGGFSGVQFESYVAQKAWTITQFGNYVIPRVVYVRYKDVNGTLSPTFQDDIILDVTPPTGSIHVASVQQASTADMLSDVTLQLNANDDVSGVGFMMLSSSSDFASVSLEPYISTKIWPITAAPKVYVKYRDNAGNFSTVYSTDVLTTNGLLQVFLPLIQH